MSKKKSKPIPENEEFIPDPSRMMMIGFIPFGFEQLDYLNYDFENCLTRQDVSGPYDKEDVVAALLMSRGAVGEAALLLGRSRSNLISWLAQHPDVQAIVYDYRQAQLDIVERTTIEHAVIFGEGPDRRFLLQTIGKDRGYSSRVEATGKDGGPVKFDGSIQVEFVSPTPEPE